MTRSLWGATFCAAALVVCAEGCARSATKSAAPTLKDLAGKWVGTPTRGMDIVDVARIAYINPARLPPGMDMGLEARARYTPTFLAPVTLSVAVSPIMLIA